MPYVAPMPNPDLVTGPDWTQLLGAVAVGLTKGVGEGAEIIQRDRAQRAAEQNAAKEQAFRDRQMEFEQTRWKTAREEDKKKTKGLSIASMYNGLIPYMVDDGKGNQVPIAQVYGAEEVEHARAAAPGIHAQMVHNEYYNRMGAAAGVKAETGEKKAADWREVKLESIDSQKQIAQGKNETILGAANIRADASKYGVDNRIPPKDFAAYLLDENKRQIGWTDRMGGQHYFGDGFGGQGQVQGSAPEVSFNGESQKTPNIVNAYASVPAMSEEDKLKQRMRDSDAFHAYRQAKTSEDIDNPNEAYADSALARRQDPELRGAINRQRDWQAVQNAPEDVKQSMQRLHLKPLDIVDPEAINTALGLGWANQYLMEDAKKVHDYLQSTGYTVNEKRVNEIKAIKMKRATNAKP